MSQDSASSIARTASTSALNSHRRQVFFALTLLMLGCGLNNVALEAMVKIDPGSGNLLTFLQFLFIASYEFFAHSFDFRKFWLRPRKVALRYYLLMTFVFAVLSVVNNMAFDYHISQPLHMVFRSSTLAASLIVGLLFHERYSGSQIVGVIFVTVGVCVVTLVSSWDVAKINSAHNQITSPCSAGGCGTDLPPSVETPMVVNESLLRFYIGIAMLTFALFLSAALGHIQQLARKKFGKDWRENLFYTHFLALPTFAVLWEDVLKHAILWTNSEPLFSIVGIGIPCMWVYVAVNVVAQYICLIGVYQLGDASGPLTLTLATTLRKFLSLLVSIVYFSNPFTVYHAFGTVLVFSGTIIYSVWKEILEALRLKPKTA